MLRNLDFILLMLEYHLKILGKGTRGTHLGFREDFGSVVACG